MSNGAIHGIIGLKRISRIVLSTTHLGWRSTTYDETQLVPGAGDRLELRLPGGQYLALHSVFGRPVRVADDHYRWPFSIDT